MFDRILPPALPISLPIRSLFVQLRLPPLHRQLRIHARGRTPLNSFRKVVDFVLLLLPGRVAVLMTPDDLREVDAKLV